MTWLRPVLNFLIPALVIGLIVGWVVSWFGLYAVSFNRPGSTSLFSVGAHSGTLFVNEQRSPGYRGRLHKNFDKDRLELADVRGKLDAHWFLQGGRSDYWQIEIPFPLPLTCLVPLVIGSLYRFRLRLWHWFVFTGLIAAQLAYYLPASPAFSNANPPICW